MAIYKVEICGVNTQTLPVLSHEVMRELLKRVRAGDKEARRELIQGNLRLVLSVIQRFHNRGENVDDLFQIGCIGLIKGIDNFDVTLNVRLSTYCVPMVIRCRDKREDAYIMTRKQALITAVESLTDLETIEKLNEIIAEMPFIRWTEAAIHDAFRQFALDHGRNARISDLRSASMPSAPTVALRFGMSASAFIAAHYPKRAAPTAFRVTQVGGITGLDQKIAELEARLQVLRVSEPM